MRASKRNQVLGWFITLAFLPVSLLAKEQNVLLSGDLRASLLNATSSPVVHGEEVIFFYRGTAQRVEVVGDFTGWRSRSLIFQTLDGTNIKYLTQTFTSGARVEYKLIVDNQWMLDPANKTNVDNGMGGTNSVLEMPGYRPAKLLPVKENQKGSIIEAHIESRHLNGQRRLKIYLPAGYEQNPSSRYPVLYIEDGTDYLNRAAAAQTADSLIANKKLIPLIIVFIDPFDRGKDYWLNDAFADFLAQELVTQIDARYRTRPERGSRALLGASLGGIISVWTVLKYPEIFARLGAQSTAFQIENEKALDKLQSFVAEKHEKAFQFYFDVGTFEPVLDAHRRVRELLRTHGYPVTYRETAAGHNWTAWRDRLSQAYLGLWANYHQ